MVQRRRFRRAAKWVGTATAGLILLAWGLSYRWAFVCHTGPCGIFLRGGQWEILGWDTPPDLPSSKLEISPRSWQPNNVWFPPPRWSFAPNNTWLIVPLWLLGLLAALPTTRLWWLDRQREIPAGHCRQCGYNLTGNTSGLCSECGTRVPG